MVHSHVSGDISALRGRGPERDISAGVQDVFNLSTGTCGGDSPSALAALPIKDPSGISIACTSRGAGTGLEKPRTQAMATHDRCKLDVVTQCSWGGDQKLERPTLIHCDRCASDRRSGKTLILEERSQHAGSLAGWPVINAPSVVSSAAALCFGARSTEVLLCFRLGHWVNVNKLYVFKFTVARACLLIIITTHFSMVSLAVQPLPW
jgi:hypothetical protein